MHNALIMNFIRYKLLGPIGLIIFVFAMIVSSCNRGRVAHHEEKKKDSLSFKPVYGIPFTEVRRRLKNGMSFDNNGFQTEPSYKITFLANDSASVYSPEKKQFINFFVFMEGDSIFNVARSYFKMMQMSKDSLKLQVLEVQGDTLHMKHSLVYMTFYSNDYLKNVLKTNAATLGKPDRNDTLFIKKKAELANRIPDSAFSARIPVTMESRSPRVTVKYLKIKPDVSNNFDDSDGYMNPEFNITINKAYEGFSYSFWAFVDDKGQMYFDRSVDYIMPEYRESTTKTIKAIIDGYLKYYLIVKPGNTLGIVHTSAVLLNVVGRK
ncbi:hypothetical protein SAMN05216490_1788 [Mucilaginibacter mallensis]|uniref:Uncharacterized protein n=2 Tax=Mucilaginibacter mallensis TaxID=652787 RepID=A0A1H1V025_MUCMA|nr:hypothetical protein SAMN05216490_1788 [Mucilaginibacter mallensis]